ncbi:MAG: cytochrome c-type biogenesis protein CcmH [Paracoccaceae bacterium]
MHLYRYLEPFKSDTIGCFTTFNKYFSLWAGPEGQDGFKYAYSRKPIMSLRFTLQHKEATVAFLFNHISFWITILAICTGFVFFLIFSFRSNSFDVNAYGFDLHLYKKQLADIEKDCAKGLLLAAEADPLRLEVSRRILEAERKMKTQKKLQKSQQPIGLSGKSIIIGASASAILAAIVLYVNLGAFGYPDMGIKQRLALADQIYASRPSQKDAEAKNSVALPRTLDPEYEKLMQALRAAVEGNVGDVTGLTLLARNEANIGNFSAAAKAMAEVIDRRSNPSAQLYIDLVEWMIFATNGYISPQAEDALRLALALDPENGLGRYYSGLMFIQIGRPDMAFNIWSRLLDTSKPNAVWLKTLRGQMPALAALAGQKYALPKETPMPTLPALKGPSADDMAEAADMSGQDRQNMVITMVEGLHTRLANTGGTPNEWARLIKAYGILGKTAEANVVYIDARRTFAQDQSAVATITVAAQSAGLKP